MTCRPHGYDRTYHRMDGYWDEQQRNRERWEAWAGAVSGAVQGARGGPASARIRIGDAEREHAVTALGEHYAAGRLTKDEFDERSGAAWSATTAGDLAPLFADLPGLQVQPAPRVRAARPGPGGWWLGVRLWWVFMLLFVLAAADEVPWLAVAVFVVLWWSGAFAGVHRWARRGSGHRS
jgi:hypothetical protein